MTTLREESRKPYKTDRRRLMLLSVAAAGGGVPVVRIAWASLGGVVIWHPSGEVTSEKYDTQGTTFRMTGTTQNGDAT